MTSMLEYMQHNVYKTLVLYLIVTNCQGHWDPAYMRSPSDGFKLRVDWMGKICDNMQLSEMALPGTEDSSSFDNVGGYLRWLEKAVAEGSVAAVLTPGAAPKLITSMSAGLFSRFSKTIMTNKERTHCLNFKEQLEFGIRVIDLRIWHDEDRFKLVHYLTYLNMDIHHALATVSMFLSNNPSETVILVLIIQKDTGEHTKSAQDLMDETLKMYKHYLKTTNPKITLGETRGKFIVMPINKGLENFGIQYYSSDFDIMDSGHLNTHWELYYKKWVPIKAHLEKAANGNKDKFYFTYLNGYGGTFPYLVASGHIASSSSAPRMSTGLSTFFTPQGYPDFPRTACLRKWCTISFEGTNVLTRDKIQNHYNKGLFTRTVGIVSGDFPGDSLIETVIKNNEKFNEKC